MKNLIKMKDIIIDTKSGFSGAGKNLEKKFKHKKQEKSTFIEGEFEDIEDNDDSKI